MGARLPVVSREKLTCGKLPAGKLPLVSEHLCDKIPGGGIQTFGGESIFCAKNSGKKVQYRYGGRKNYWRKTSQLSLLGIPCRGGIFPKKYCTFVKNSIKPHWFICIITTTCTGLRHIYSTSAHSFAGVFCLFRRAGSGFAGGIALELKFPVAPDVSKTRVFTLLSLCRPGLHWGPCENTAYMAYIRVPLLIKKWGF